MFTLIACALLLTGTTGVVEGSADSPQVPDGIKIHKVIRTWEKADLQCKTEGAVLASPITAKLLHAMKSVISMNDAPYFIGTKLNENSGSFVSVEGVPLDNMTDAVMKMIKELDPYDGSCLSMDQNNIRVVSCCKRLPFMCYKAQIDDSNVTTQETEHERTTETTITDMCGTDVEGVPLDNMTDAVMKMIKELDPYDGSCLSMDQNNIRVVSCCKRLPFMCYKAQIDDSNVTTQETEHERTTETTITDMCGTDVEGYKYFVATGSCYKLHEDMHTWVDAAATCLDEGSHLVVIDNVAEARIITNEMGINRDFPFTYIGLHDYTGQNDWRSVTGKNMGEIYNDWNFGRPSGQPGLLCGVIRPLGKIDNYGCDLVATFICERPARVN